MSPQPNGLWDGSGGHNPPGPSRVDVRATHLPLSGPRGGASLSSPMLPAIHNERIPLLPPRLLNIPGPFSLSPPAFSSVSRETSVTSPFTSSIEHFTSHGEEVFRPLDGLAHGDDAARGPSTFPRLLPVLLRVS